MILYQDCSSHLDSSKNIAARGGGGGVGGGGGGAGLIFPIYLYRKLKKSSRQKPLERLQYNVAEMFLCDPLPRLFKPFGFVKKHGRQGGGAYFPYISI